MSEIYASSARDRLALVPMHNGLEVFEFTSTVGGEARVFFRDMVNKKSGEEWPKFCLGICWSLDLVVTMCWSARSPPPHSWQLLAKKAQYFGTAAMVSTAGSATDTLPGA